MRGRIAGGLGGVKVGTKSGGLTLAETDLHECLKKPDEPEPRGDLVPEPKLNSLQDTRATPSTAT